MNITETMKVTMNVDNCDVLNENGKLRLIYALDGFPTPLILAQANSYHELNEKALRIFDAKKWMRFLIDESADVSTSAFHPLVADMYKNHHEIYTNVTSDILLNKVNGDNVDCPDDEDDTDECDGDCDNCEFAELDDRYEKDDDSCKAEEHPEWPHPIEEDTNAQPEAPQYEYVNGPAHYHGTECIENMRKLFGDEAVRWFCICNAYKYRFRDGSKPGVTAEQDEKKARWYEDYAVKMMNEQRYY